MNIDRQPNMHDLSWFVDMDNQNRLELNPPYQRRSVWTASDRHYFLDTIFNNYPCPAVYVQKEIGPQGPRYNVVDGKQRLSTILNFYNNKIRLPRNFTIPRLSGKRFKDLETPDVVDFYNYVFLVETLKASGDTEWNEVFFRVNKNQKGLKDQELRHARFDGWFIGRAELETDNPKEGSGLFWSSIKISTPAKSKRMKDVEFISTLMLVILERDFVGFPQSNIDELYAKYDFKLEDLRSEDDIFSEYPDELGIEEANGDEDGAVEASVMYKEDVEKFESKFFMIKEFVRNMEAHNQAVTKYSRRITTDFYSLWSVLTLSDVVSRLSPEEVADAYAVFIEEVDNIYDVLKDEKSGDTSNASEGADANIFAYYTHSIGAATTAEYRKIRYEAFLNYLETHFS